MNGKNINEKIETIHGDYSKFFENVYYAIVDKNELAVKPEEALTTTQIIELAMESNKKRSVIEFSN